MLRGIQNTSAAYGLSCVPKYVALAPRPDRQHLNLDFENISASDKTYQMTRSEPQAASIAKRNARERNRVKQVNDGFNALRKRLPTAVVNALSGGARRGSGKKLSKVDTLRMVVEYIKHLQNLLDTNEAAVELEKAEKTIRMSMDTTRHEVDEGIFAGGHSPYYESVPSPANSDCSSGVSCSYSSNISFCTYNYHSNEESVIPVNDDELLNAISWWQHK